MAFITDKYDECVEPVRGNFPASMGQVYQGIEATVHGYRAGDTQQNWDDHVWRVCDDIDNSDTFGRRWVERMAEQGYDTKFRTVWYTTIITTEEHLARWEKANEYGGPCLYWP